MKILVAGHRGNFGKAILNYFQKSGHLVTGFETGEDMPEDLSDFDACLLAVPVEAALSLIQKLRGCSIIEICSVKEPFRKFSGKVISIHPMFGPRSIGNPDFSNIILVEDISARDGRRVVSLLFPGHRIVEMTAAEHDCLMGEVLVKPYLLSRLAGKVKGPDSKYGGTSYKTFRALSEIAFQESPQVMEDTIRLNPFTPEIVRAIKKEAGDLADQYL